MTDQDRRRDRDRDPYEDEDNDRQMRITDPDEHHKTRRLNQIHNAREKFTEVYRKVEASYRTRNGRQAIAAVALDYVRQLEPLVERSGDELLDETVTVGGQSVTLTTLLDHGGTVTTQKRVQRGRNQIAWNTETTTHHMDKATSLKVVRMCDRWLDEYIDFDIEDTPDEWQV